MMHDEARPPLSGEIRPHPLHEDADAKARLAQELEVHGGPCHPREKAAEVDPAAVEHGEALADDGHRSFVEVPKRLRRGLSRDASPNQPGCIAPLLHRDLRDAGEGTTVLIERRGVADDEDLRMTADGQVRLHADAAGVIRCRLEPLARRGGRHARRPDHGLAGDALTGYGRAVGVDMVHALTEPHLDAELFEATLR